MMDKNYPYMYEDRRYLGYLAYREAEPKPAVLVVHDWSGRNELACQQAELLADLGYIGFAVDMFGDGVIGSTVDEKQALIAPLLANRQRLLGRMMQALATVKQLPMVDTTRIAIIGFCFGGLCALDVARSGAAIQGVVSFHGVLNPPSPQQGQVIAAKVLALHGYDDPMVPPQQVNDFAAEMTQAKADWQIHMYGNTQHAFTNPSAHDLQLGTMYNALAHTRSVQSMQNFLTEIFHHA